MALNPCIGKISKKKILTECPLLMPLCQTKININKRVLRWDLKIVEPICLIINEFDLMYVLHLWPYAKLISVNNADSLILNDNMKMHENKLLRRVILLDQKKKK